MLLAIISAVVCLAAATVMYTPRLRNFAHYRPIGMIFLFEGVWVLLDYIFRQLSPDNVAMDMIHYIGLALLGVYFIGSVFLSSGKKSKSQKPPAKSKKFKEH